MAYSLNFSRQALKELEKINEPYYSNIKQAINNLTWNPRPQGYKKLKERRGYRIPAWLITALSTIFVIILLVDVINLGHRKDVYK